METHTTAIFARLRPEERLVVGLRWMDRFSERGNPDFYWDRDWWKTTVTAVRTINARLLVHSLGTFSRSEMDVYLRVLGFVVTYARQAFVREVHALVADADE